jgi:hypothetical protein
MNVAGCRGRFGQQSSAGDKTGGKMNVSNKKILFSPNFKLLCQIKEK